MTKKIHKLIPAVALALAASKASAQILYEPFNYANGLQLDANAASANKNYTSSGTYWSERGTQAGLITVANPGLAGPTAFGPTMGGAVNYPSANTGRTPVVGFGQTITSGDAYYSLTLKAPGGTLGSTSGFFAGFANFATPTPAALSIPQAGLRYQRVTTTSYQLGIQNANTSTTQFFPTAFTAADTVNVVVRYRIVDGAANDLIDMWVNPTTNLGDTTAPATSVTQIVNNSDAVDSASPSLPMLASFFTRSFSSMTGFTLDEVRVDTTWAGVAPDGTKQFTFNNAAGGAWSTIANWNDYQGNAAAIDPNALGVVANFGSGITSGSTITVDGGSGKTVAQLVFNNAGSLTVAGDGSNPLTFSSNASAAQVYNYAGSHTISAPINLSSNLSFKTATGTTTTLSGAISGTGKVLGVYGTGTVKLASSELIANDVKLEARSGTLDLNGGTETVDTVTLGTGHPNNGTALGTGVLYNGDLASGTIANGVIVASSYDLQSGTISAEVGGTGGVTKNNSGFVTLSGNNTYTGTTTVNSGQLTLSGTNSNPLNAVIGLTPQVGGAISNLAITSNAALGANGATVTWTPHANVGSGALLLLEDMTIPSDRVLNINHSASRIGAAAGKTGTIQSVLSGTGGVGITNSGTIVLDAVNTYSGNTTLFSGTLQVANQNQIGDGSGTNNLVFGSGTLKTAASLGTVNKTVALIAGGTGTVDTNGFDTTFAGVVSGAAIVTPATAAGGLTKVGSGTLVLSGTNTYEGITNVNGGTLRITNSDALGASGAGAAANRTNINGGGGLTNLAVLELDGTAGSITVADEVRIGGKTSTGGGNSSASLRSLAGNNTVSAARLDSGGTWYNIESASGSNLTISGITNALTGSTRQLFLQGAGNGAITGAITATSAVDSYVLVKQGAGTWTLSGANTYSWANNVNVNQTTVEGGILRTVGAGTLGAAGGPVLNNAIIQSYSSNALGTVNGTGAVIVGDGATPATVSATYFRQGQVTVADGSTASVAADATANGTSKVTLFSIGSTGKFDLKRNKLITSAPLGAEVGGTYGGLQGEVQRASNGGAWDGFGLTTSEGDAVGGLTSIGVATGEQILGLGPTDTALFAGQTITGASTVAMYTYAGDANMDGLISGDDYAAIDLNVAIPGADGWYNGDFNYDGIISGDDYAAIDLNIALQGAPFPTGGSAGLSGVTAVPEPASLSVVGLTALGLTSRRRRRQAR